MIVLKIFLGILWFLVVFLYCILCGVHIKQAVFRVAVLLFLGLSVLLSYFVFPKIVFLSLSGVGVFFYILWEFYEAHLRKYGFKPNKFIKHFCSWIFIREEGNLISIVFPNF